MRVSILSLLLNWNSSQTKKDKLANFTFHVDLLFCLFCHHRCRNRGAPGLVPPRFCNKQRSALFIFRKCPLLGNKGPWSVVPPPQFWDAFYLPVCDCNKSAWKTKRKHFHFPSKVFWQNRLCTDLLSMSHSCNKRWLHHNNFSSSSLYLKPFNDNFLN